MNLKVDIVINLHMNRFNQGELAKVSCLNSCAKGLSYYLYISSAFYASPSPPRHIIVLLTLIVVYPPETISIYPGIYNHCPESSSLVHEPARYNGTSCATPPIQAMFTNSYFELVSSISTYGSPTSGSIYPEPTGFSIFTNAKFCFLSFLKYSQSTSKNGSTNAGFLPCSER